jgi:large subunit ribosomal protein L25
MELNATKREVLGKASRRLRHQGRLPAVVYGQGHKPQALEVDGHEFDRILVRAGHTQLIDLVVGSGRPHKVLIKEVQRSPRKNTPVHVDFHQVSLREKIQVEVPLAFVGEAPGVKAGLGDLMQLSHNVRVECLPTAIPESIEVDIAPLEDLDSSIRIADLTLPEGVVVVGDPEDLIAKIQPSRVAAEEEAEGEEEAAEGAEVAASAEEGGEPTSSSEE